MTPSTCDRCGNTTITFYRQRRKDGMTVVTARCANGHIPQKGRPFYPISQFDLRTLPPLPSQVDNQPVLFDAPRHSVLGSGKTKWERLMGSDK